METKDMNNNQYYVKLILFLLNKPNLEKSRIK